MWADLSKLVLRWSQFSRLNTLSTRQMSCDWLSAVRSKIFFMWDTNELDVHVSDIPKLVLRGLDKIHVQRISESQQLSINLVQDTFNSRKRCSS